MAAEHLSRQTLATIAQKDGEQPPYQLCPHTAVGVTAAERLQLASTPTAPTLCLATAHHAKFPEAFERATGHAPVTPPAIAALTGQPTRCADLPAVSPAALHEFIQRTFARPSE